MKPATIPTYPCPECGGTGRIMDQRCLGQQLRALRVKHDLSLRQAAKRINYSAAYLSDLELGRRRVTLDLIAACKAEYRKKA